MPFPVDILNSCSHEELERSAEKYFSDLQNRNPDHPEFLSVPGHGKIPISLPTVGFVPLYGEEQTHKVLALFAPGDSLTAVSLYLADQWWSIDDIVRTSVPARQGLHQVKSVGERVVLYVLNRIIYRKQEMEGNDIPFLCHGSSDYAKIMWKKGEAIGFYSVKPTGSVHDSYCSQRYKLPVLDTIFVRKKHPCKQYLEKYPEDKSLFWEVEGAGHWLQRRSIMQRIQRENLQMTVASRKENKTTQATVGLQQSAAVSEASGQKTELETHLSVGTQSVAHILKRLENFYVCFTHVISDLKRPRIGRYRQEPEPETSQGSTENALPVSIFLNTCCRLKLPARTPEILEDLVEVPEDNTDEESEKTILENKSQSASEAELHVSPPEKQSEKEETPSEPLNGEVEETGKTSLVTEEKTVNEVPSDESKLQSESQGEEPVTQLVPLILESSAKPSEDAVSEKVLSANDSEMLTEESTSVEKEGSEEQQESEKTTTENTAASLPKEEPSDNGLLNSMLSEAAEETPSENSVEGPNEEAGHSLSQSSVIVVEVEGASLQPSAGQEGQQNQLEEHSEGSAEQRNQSTQTIMEQGADSSSEEMEVEVPIVDRRNLRRKAKGYKGPPKKKGKPA
ncbi:F169A protein, partial [Hemiprocne comata]|nr:F169A protein [Hemiprocne comata]